MSKGNTDKKAMIKKMSKIDRERVVRILAEFLYEQEQKKEKLEK